MPLAITVDVVTKKQIAIKDDLFFFKRMQMKVILFRQPSIHLKNMTIKVSTKKEDNSTRWKKERDIILLKNNDI